MKRNENSFIRWGVLARRHPSAFLLAAQLVSLVLYAAFDRNTNGQVLLGSFGIVILLLVVWVITRSPTMQWVAWILVVPAVVFSVLSILFASPSLLVWSSLLEATLYFYAAGSLVRYMMGDYRVTIDELFAAGATFTLLAWGFAYAFFVCQAWYPDSFTGAVEPERPRRWIELLFLSFSTLSGVGNGDIIPLGSPARVLVMFEQFAGVGYIAAVVSRLIGLTIVRQRERE